MITEVPDSGDAANAEPSAHETEQEAEAPPQEENPEENKEVALVE